MGIENKLEIQYDGKFKDYDPNKLDDSYSESDGHISTYAVILSGGKGSRLYSLTAKRAKPAVPLFGGYRMIDFVMSNCKRSNIDNIDILTQYVPDSLNNHLSNGRPWGYDERHLSVRGPSENRSGMKAYHGTADAVRDVSNRIKNKKSKAVLILSGDHVYSENYKNTIVEHKSLEASLTIYTKVVPLSEITSFGAMKVNPHGRIVDFEEKPKDKKRQKDFILSDFVKSRFKIETDEPVFLASMGVYVFSPEILLEQLEMTGNDFGSDIIPRMVKDNSFDVHAHVFNNYWEDVGRLDKLIEANFYGLNNPEEIFNTHLKTNQRDLPSPIITGKCENSIISPGSIIYPGATVENSVLGYQTIVLPGATIKNSIIHGADRHETHITGNTSKERYSVIRPGAYLENVLLDRNIIVNEDVVLIGKQNLKKTTESLESIGLKENSDENPMGLYNITDEGYLIFGKPSDGDEFMFPKGFSTK